MTIGRLETKLEDFRSVLSFRNPQGEQLVIVGGQAVNFWGEYYLKTEPEIADHLPLTSRDLDLLGTTSDLEALAKEVHGKVTFSKPGAATPVLGAVEFTTSRGDKTSIEVLFSLYGIGPRELKSAIAEVYNSKLDLKLRLLNPITCLKAKVHNLLGLEQGQRQDLKHLKILIVCNRGFLRDVLKQAEAGTVSERAAVNSFEALFEFTQLKEADRVAKLHQLEWKQLFPIVELQRTPLTRLQRFLHKRLEQAFSKWTHD